MSEFRALDTNKIIFTDNERQADELRKELREKKIFLLNLMSSPGAGKTMTLTRTIQHLKDKMKIAVMEAAQETDMDAHLIEPTGAEVVELHMDESCHMDATMAKQGIEGFRMDDMDLIILENAGDFACPAEFDIGSSINAMIISVPEGDDKPLKCPLMFSDCDVVLINKIDVLPCFDFNLERCKENIWMRNPNAKVIPISALTEEGISEWTDWLMQEVELW